MAITKADLLKLVESLPENVTVEEVMTELYVRSKIDAGLQQLEEGKGIPHHQVKEQIKQWRS